MKDDLAWYARYLDWYAVEHTHDRRLRTQQQPELRTRCWQHVVEQAIEREACERLVHQATLTRLGFTFSRLSSMRMLATVLPPE